MATVNDGRKVIEVLPDQVWEDNDPRQTGQRRRLKVVEIRGLYAICENVRTARHTKINLARFRQNSTGYTLVS